MKANISSLEAPAPVDADGRMSGVARPLRSELGGKEGAPIDGTAAPAPAGATIDGTAAPAPTGAPIDGTAAPTPAGTAAPTPAGTPAGAPIEGTAAGAPIEGTAAPTPAGGAVDGTTVFVAGEARRASVMAGSSVPMRSEAVGDTLGAVAATSEAGGESGGRVGSAADGV